MSKGILTAGVHLWWWGMEVAGWEAHRILTGRDYGGFFLKLAKRASLHSIAWNLFFFVFLFWQRPLWLDQGPSVMFYRGKQYLPFWVFMLIRIWVFMDLGFHADKDLLTYLFGNYQSMTSPSFPYQLILLFIQNGKVCSGQTMCQSS